MEVLDYGAMNNNKTKFAAKKTSLVDADYEESDEHSDDEEGVTSSSKIVSKALKDLVGFKDTESLEMDSGDVLASFMIAGSTLNSKVKSKIWNCKYVELGSLARKDSISSGLNVNYEAGSLSQICFTSAKVRQLANVYVWFRWFAR